MFENLGVDFGCLGDACNLIVINSETEEVSYLENDYSGRRTINSCIGNLRIQYNDEATEYGMYLDRKELFTSTVEGNNERIRIC